MNFNFIPSPFNSIEINNKIMLIPKNNKITHTLIWLHDQNETAEKYINIFNNNKNSPIPENIKIIIPKSQISSNNNNIKLNSWFNILDQNNLNLDSNYNIEDIINSSNNIINIIHKEAALLEGDYSKIIIGGFGQGAILSMNIGLSLEKKLGAIICCSGTLLDKTEIKNNDINIFIGHGKNDKIFNIDDFLNNKLKRLENNKNIEKHIYNNIEHEICNEEFEDIKNFLIKIIKK